MEDRGVRLVQAVDLEKNARSLEAKGDLAGAFAEFKACVEIFRFVYKWENNPNSKELVRERLDAVLTHTEELRDRLSGSGGTTGPPSAGTHVTAAQAAAAAAVGGGAAAEESAEEREAQRRKKGLESAILAETPDVRWADVAGLSNAKAALQESVILPARFPQLFEGARRPWKGILLYGPPGTGKTHLAKACATEANATFFSISSSDLVSKWLGESEKLVRSLFEMARESRPAIIFIDEVDSLCGSRNDSGDSSGSSRRITTEFLAQMDGCGKDVSRVLVLGATNTPWDLDAGIRRRFEKRIHIALPDLEARAVILETCIGDTPSQLTREDVRTLAGSIEGYSGADISVLVRDASFEPVRRCQRARTFKQVWAQGRGRGVKRWFWTPCSPGDPQAVERSLMDVPPEELLEPPVLKADLEAAARRTRPSVSTVDLKAYEDFTAAYGVDG